MSATPSTEPLQIAYRSAGAGPPELLLVHGWAGSGAYFEELIDALDLSGHGDSPDVDGDWSLERIDDAILSVADAVGAQRSVPWATAWAGSSSSTSRFATPIESRRSSSSPGRRRPHWRCRRTSWTAGTRAPAT